MGRTTERDPEVVIMALEVTRLQLATLRGVDGLDWPVHGFLVRYPGGAVLVDTGVGGPPTPVSTRAAPPG